MKRLIVLLVITPILLFVYLTPCFAEEEDIKEQAFNAKVARIKARQRALARKNGTEGEESGCGGVNVGNVQSDTRVGDVNNVVVVEGDIINIAKNCKKD